tara:strand:+ start:2279 stop:2545 length:267 start_codon:yes stop_codon:yes gene_type:complete
MSKEEVIELLESLKGDTSGHMQSIAETIYEGIFNARIDEVIKELNQNKEDERIGTTSAYERISVIARMKDKTSTGLTRDDLLNQNNDE